MIVRILLSLSLSTVALVLLAAADRWERGSWTPRQGTTLRIQPPVHIGLAGADSVDVEVTSLRTYRRILTRQVNIAPAAYQGRWLVVQVP